MSRADDFSEYLNSLDDDARTKVFATAQGQVYLFVEAVAQQARRLRLSHSVTHTEHQADAILFVYATRDLLRLVTFAREMASGFDTAKVDAALDSFVAAIPDAKDARDVLAHLDEYIAGFGKRQQPGDDPSLPWFSRNGAKYVVRVGDLSIDVDIAEAAAIEAASAILILR